MTLLNTVLSSQTYICGDKISIADISAACEIWQLGFIQKDFSKHIHISRWFKHMQTIPEMQNAHKFIDEAIKKTKKQEAKL